MESREENYFPVIETVGPSFPLLARSFKRNLRYVNNWFQSNNRVFVMKNGQENLDLNNWFFRSQISLASWRSEIMIWIVTFKQKGSSDIYFADDLYAK
jgi:hypothetical protein